VAIKEKIKFKNADEAHVWSRFAAAVVEACDADELHELPGEAAALADKFIVDEYRKRVG
jgi:hypothetical protein